MNFVAAYALFKLAITTSSPPRRRLDELVTAFSSPCFEETTFSEDDTESRVLRRTQMVRARESDGVMTNNKMQMCKVGTALIY